MEHQQGSSNERRWSGEHRATLHRVVAQKHSEAPPAGEAGVHAAARTDTRVDTPGTQLYRVIRHADGSAFHDGDPVTLADAQLMLNDAILDGRVEVGSFLHVEPDELTIRPPDGEPGD